jgi:hypothetical protein
MKKIQKILITSCLIFGQIRVHGSDEKPTMLAQTIANMKRLHELLIPLHNDSENLSGNPRQHATEIEQPIETDQDPELQELLSQRKNFIQQMAAADTIARWAESHYQKTSRTTPVSLSEFEAISRTSVVNDDIKSPVTEGDFTSITSTPCSSRLQSPAWNGNTPDDDATKINTEKAEDLLSHHNDSTSAPTWTAPFYKATGKFINSLTRRMGSEDDDSRTECQKNEHPRDWYSRSSGSDPNVIKQDAISPEQWSSIYGKLPKIIQSACDKIYYFNERIQQRK